MEPLIAMGAGGIISICLVFGYWGLAEEKPRRALRWYKAANTIAAVSYSSYCASSALVMRMTQ
ncbi:MAG: hypothetical protein HXL00_00710 [Candidatus Nanosynbacter sp.]|nr:hypothetical protein [Candidatus Nanosynbacter sp.]